jgi:hypothetical protein
MGPITKITNVGLNTGTEWSGAVVFAGNLVPAAFATPGYGFPAHATRRLGDRELEISDCRGNVPSAGSVVWLSSTTVERGNHNMLLSRYAEMNLVNSVDGCNVSLAYSITAPTGEPVALHWKETHGPSWAGAPEIPIKRAGIRDITLESAAGQAFTVSGCYRCTFENIVVARSRSLFSVEGTRGSLFQNIRGNFTERGIELAEFSTENTIRDIKGVYIDSAKLPSRPALRFGEYAFGNDVSDVVMDLRQNYLQTIKIRFDGSSNNHLADVKLLMTKPQRADTLRMYLPPGTSHERGDILPDDTTLKNVQACYPVGRETRCLEL